MNTKKQAVAPKTTPILADVFDNQNNTMIYWLGNAGVLINSHGTSMMVDPLLEGFDMPLLIDMPIVPSQVPHLDSVLLTHCDNDHFSRLTCKDLKPVCKRYDGPHYVASLLQEENLPGIGHAIHESFMVNDVKVTLTPADHAWQNEHKKYQRVYQFEDYCGFWIETQDGNIFIPGDSRLLQEQLEMPTPDLIVFDFSNNSWHIGLQDAIVLANAYPTTPLLLSHWGSVDAPTMDAFNGDPQDIYDNVVNPERILLLAPGTPYCLKKIKA